MIAKSTSIKAHTSSNFQQKTCPNKPQPHPHLSSSCTFLPPTKILQWPHIKPCLHQSLLKYPEKPLCTRFQTTNVWSTSRWTQYEWLSRPWSVCTIQCKQSHQRRHKYPEHQEHRSEQWGEWHNHPPEACRDAANPRASQSYLHFPHHPFSFSDDHVAAQSAMETVQNHPVTQNMKETVNNGEVSISRILYNHDRQLTWLGKYCEIPPLPTLRPYSLILGPATQDVRVETAKAKSEFADLANSRTTPDQPAATGQPLTSRHPSRALIPK